MSTAGMTATALAEVGDRVVVLRYGFFDQSIGVVLGDDGVLVIDSRTSHRQGTELLRDLRRLTRLPVRVVVNTHRHSDHCFGNHVLRPATIWGHVRCAAGLLETGADAQRELAEAFPDRAEDWAAVVLDPPDRTFRAEATISIGGRLVEMRYLGRGHTDGDIVVSVPDAGVLFVGDLLENGAPPSYGDAFPLEWPATAAALLPLVAGPVVPGHGDPADRAFAEGQAGELAATAELVRRVAIGDVSEQQALSEGPFGPDTTRVALARGLARPVGLGG